MSGWSNGPGSPAAPSGEALATIVAENWERDGYSTRIREHDEKLFVFATSQTGSTDCVWVVPAAKNQLLSENWVDLYRGLLADMDVSTPFIAIMDGFSDEDRERLGQLPIVGIDRRNLESLLLDSGLGLGVLQNPEGHKPTASGNETVDRGPRDDPTRTAGFSEAPGEDGEPTDVIEEASDTAAGGVDEGGDGRPCTVTTAGPGRPVVGADVPGDL